jgi:hypothetical protein
MQVRVRNKSDIDFVGTFRDKPIAVPGGDYIEMGRAEALKFIGEWSPVKIDGAGRHLAPKMLVIEEDPEVKAERYSQPLRYEAMDGTKFRTKEGLAAYDAALQTDISEVDSAKPIRRRKAKEI